MADKKETSKIVLERTYIVPLRSETLKVPFYRKSKKAISALLQFIVKHMKSEDVSIGKYLNMKIWENGMQNPPGKVKITVTKDDKGKVIAELFGAPKDEPKTGKKTPAKSEKDEKKTPEQKSVEKLEAKVEEKKEEKAEEAKKIEKEEIKEMQKESHEHPAKQHAPKEVQKKKEVQQHPPAPKHV